MTSDIFFVISDIFFVHSLFVFFCHQALFVFIACRYPGVVDFKNLLDKISKNPVFLRKVKKEFVKSKYKNFFGSEVTDLQDGPFEAALKSPTILDGLKNEVRAQDKIKPYMTKNKNNLKLNVEISCAPEPPQANRISIMKVRITGKKLEERLNAGESSKGIKGIFSPNDDAPAMTDKELVKLEGCSLEAGDFKFTIKINEDLLLSHELPIAARIKTDLFPGLFLDFEERGDLGMNEAEARLCRDGAMNLLDSFGISYYMGAFAEAFFGVRGHPSFKDLQMLFPTGIHSMDKSNALLADPTGKLPPSLGDSVSMSIALLVVLLQAISTAPRSLSCPAGKLRS